MLLLAAVVSAAPLIVSVSEEHALGVGGGWGRIFQDDDDATAWRFLWSAGGDYVLLPMTPELTVSDTGRTPLTGRTNLVDHGITRCPDGSFLHAASANLDSFNDSAYTFRYDADLVLTAEATLAERDAGTPHNDLAVICSGVVDGVGFSGIAGDPIFVPVDADGDVGAPVTLAGAAPLMGGSLHYEADSDTILAVNFEYDGTLKVARYTTDLDPVETLEIDATEGNLRGYWAQGLMRIGDVYLLAHMARDESAGWAADEGDVWLTLFDTDWNVLERVKVSDNAPPTGGMRPGIARRGDQLLVTYDKEVQPRLFEVRLDLAAMGVEGDEDSGFVDGDDTAAGGDGKGGGGGCGCASTDAPVGTLGVVGLLGMLVRRRRA